jgi:hypothetical protein
MKKIILLFVLLFLISSCVNPVTLDSDDPEEDLTACPPACSNQDYGVFSDLVYPSTTIRQGLRVTPSVDLTGAGDADASGMVCLTNLDAEVFDDPCICNSFDLTRREVYDDEVGEYTVEFELVSFETLGQNDISVVTKYEYTTYAPIEVCLTSDPERDGSCSTGGNMLEASSGPLEVKSVSEDVDLPGGVGGSIIDLIFTVEVEAPSDATIVSLDYVYDYSCYEVPENSVTATAEILFNGQYYNCDNLQFVGENREAETTCIVKDVNLGDAAFLGDGNDQRFGKDWIEITYGLENWQTIEYEVV